MSTHSHQHLQNPVLFETKGHVEFVTLNRVGALNALNLDMVRVMLQHYQV
jgi:enoyl-CoA hydratase/carnithine racemase